MKPYNLGAIQTLAMIQVNAKLTDEKTPDLLAGILERSQDPEWREWALNAQLRIQNKAMAGN